MHHQPTTTTIAITPADEHTIKHSPLASFEIQKSHSVAASERSHGHVHSTPVVNVTRSAVVATNHTNVIHPQNHAPRQTSHTCHTVIEPHEYKNATEAQHRHSVTKYDHDHYDLNEVVKGISGWRNITPASRHGVEMRRQFHDHELVHCLVVEHNLQSHHDLAHLEFLDLDQLPSSFHRHEIYSVCLSKDVNQIQWIRDPINHPTVTTKVLFFGDHSLWTEQQVNAVTLMMHATLRPGALKTGLRDDGNVKQAEILADEYCRTVGVQRTELLKLHTSGVPSRVSKCCIENVKRLPPNRTSHTAGTVILQSRSPSITSNSALVRADSQRAVAVKRANTIEHGGVSRTVVVTPTGEHESLDLISHASKIAVHPLSSSSEMNTQKLNSEAVVVEMSPKEQKKAAKAALKAQKKDDKAAKKETYKLEKQQKKELKKAQKEEAPPQPTVITAANGSHRNNVVAPTVSLMKVSPMQ